MLTPRRCGPISTRRRGCYSARGRPRTTCGGRLNVCWRWPAGEEVLRSGIPATLIADNAAAWLMRQGLIDRVVVGADRVAANGDTANKIGTYGLAVLARAHEIPFLVAAPLSTVDFRTPDGSAIPIEERPPEEVTHVAGVPVAPEGIAAANPAFDITPHHLITAIVTEAGVATPPYTRSLLDLSATRAGR